LYSLPQPLLAWSVLGPFARNYRFSRLEAASAGPVLTLLASPVNGKDGSPLRAKEAAGSLPTGVVDLQQSVSKEGDLCAYAITRIAAPKAFKAKLWIGSDDGATVWVNGEKILEKSGERSWTPDEDKSEVALESGLNLIVVRIEQGGGECQCNVKVAEPPAGPLFEGMAPTVPPVEFDEAAWRLWALANAGDPARG